MLLLIPNNQTTVIFLKSCREAGNMVCIFKSTGYKYNINKDLIKFLLNG